MFGSQWLMSVHVMYAHFVHSPDCVFVNEPLLASRFKRINRNGSVENGSYGQCGDMTDRCSRVCERYCFGGVPFNALRPATGKKCM